MSKVILPIFLWLFLSSCQLEQVKDPFDKALAYAEKNIPTKGILRQKNDGFAYLKVDDRYIHDLFPLLEAGAGFKKPSYFRNIDSPGAHISVIYKNERITLGDELGKELSFDLIKIHSTNNKNDNFIILDVYSKDLEEIRRKYGLSPKLQGNEFHITIAKKPAAKSS